MEYDGIEDYWVNGIPNCCVLSEHWSRSVLNLEITKPRPPNFYATDIQTLILMEKCGESVHNPSTPAE